MVGEDYSGWKGWLTEQPFGVLTAGEREYFDREMRSVVRINPNIATVLEVGFGNGAFLQYCADRSWAVVGTELAPELVTAGRAAGFMTFASDLNAIQDGEFDLVVAFDVFEHIPQDDSVAFLSALATKLKPSGVILLRFPNSDTWLGNPLQHGDPTHVTEIGYIKLTNFAFRAGLEIKEFRAQCRLGFRTRFLVGLHSLMAGAVIDLIGWFVKTLYFPRTRLVFTSPNVVCVLRPENLSARVQSDPIGK